jgi:Ca2+-binding RTX toxin-like protein
VTGLAKPGVLLRASAGTWSGDTPFTFTYQWERCDATGASCRALRRATKNRYVVTTADLGSTIRVKLTTKNAYGTVSVESAPTDAVTRSPNRPKGRRIVGTANADYLPGGGGDDVILGRGGNDTLMGGAGNDTLDGGPGNDVIDGGPGLDKIYGGPGSDTILAADGQKDVIDCGEGNDKAIVDAIDVVKNCESVTIGTPATGPAASPTPGLP